MKFYMEELHGQEGKSERGREWRLVESTSGQLGFSRFYLEFQYADMLKVGRFIHTLLDVVG